ncbi:MAG: SMC family ATPase [Candidatus Micrarchaeaceae archaeon]
MINSIHLSNWKTHKDTHLTFTKGTNILIGMMGAGKSSVLDAISFALFGTFPALQHKRSSIEDIIMSRPSQEENASVRLDFAIDGKDYVVERSISRGGTAQATLTRDGAYLQSQPKRVTEEISKILNVDYDLFSRVVYSEQNRLDYFLELGPSDRKKQIDELLGIDRFSIASDNAKTLINRIKDAIADQEKVVANLDIGKIEAQLKALEEEKAKLLEEQREIEVALKNANARAEVAEKALSEGMSAYKAKQVLENEITSITSRLEFAKREVEKIDAQKLGSKEELERQLHSAEQSLEAVKNEERKLAEVERQSQGKLSKVEAGIDQLKKRIADRDKLLKEIGGKNLEKLQAEADAALNAQHDLEDKAAYYKMQMEDAKKWASELQKHISKCPLCERDLSEETRIALLNGKEQLAKMSSEMLERTLADLNMAKEKVSKLNEEISKLKLHSLRLNDYKGIDEELSKLEESLKLLEKSHAEIKKEHDSKNAALNEANKKILDLKSAIETLSRKSSYEKEIAESQQKLKERSAKLDQIKIDSATIDKLQKAYASEKSAYERAKSEEEAHKKLLNEKESQIEDRRNQIDSINKINEEISNKKKAVEELSKFNKSLSEAQVVLRTKLINAINSVMNEIWPEIYPYGDYDGLALDATGDDYELKLKFKADNGERWEKVETIASGGERSIACLAMRVAFALVLVPNLRWIILDEPTHNIDQNGLSKFIHVFNETLPKIVDQIFIITHDEILKQVSNANIYLLERNKEENEPTSAEQL